MSTNLITLIVDDDPQWREALSLALVQRGHLVLEAGTLAESRRLVAARPEVVLMDVHLPDGLSLDLAGELCALADGPVVVLMSGEAAPDKVATLVAAGLRGFLRKPFAVEDLHGLLGLPVRKPLRG